MKSSIAAAAAFIALVSAAPALADRTLSGAEAQRLLAGKRFNLQCIDGTRGTGSFSGRSVTVSYKRPAAGDDAMETMDRATVSTRGNEICLNWKQFDGGGNGCYPVAERSTGNYRLGSSSRWCDISAR
jgi:hypothetical protein